MHNLKLTHAQLPSASLALSTLLPIENLLEQNAAQFSQFATIKIPVSTE
jgi:hypothetical protein